MFDTLTVKSKFNDYTVEFVDNINKIFEQIEQENYMVFMDANIDRLYPLLRNKNNIIVICTENMKNLQGANIIFNALIEKKCNVNTKLIVIGGGILQDMVGFCASTYYRGINYISIPTTLLSQVDSCIGGKTGLNFKNKKNIIGTFHPPKNIIICQDFLKTLISLDFYNGMGEIYKFHILQNKIKSFSIHGNIKDMIYDGLKYKIDIISRDEFDKGERRFLNFGHTFGHALESSSNYIIPHGIGVVIGSIISIIISKKLEYEIDNYDDIINIGTELIKNSGIKFKKKWFDFDKLIQIVKNDKKSNGKLIMVLINNGPIIEVVENLYDVKESIKEIYEIIEKL
jgi:3-dehydroquinate synthase